MAATLEQGALLQDVVQTIHTVTSVYSVNVFLLTGAGIGAGHCWRRRPDRAADSGP
jgi:hypothetical protein